MLLHRRNVCSSDRLFVSYLKLNRVGSVPGRMAVTVPGELHSRYQRSGDGHKDEYRQFTRHPDRSRIYTRKVAFCTQVLFTKRYHALPKNNRVASGQGFSEMWATLRTTNARYSQKVLESIQFLAKEVSSVRKKSPRTSLDASIFSTLLRSL